MILITCLGGRRGRGDQSHFTRKEWVSEHRQTQASKTCVFNSYSVNSRPLSKPPWAIRDKRFFLIYHAASPVPFEIEKYTEWGFLFLHSHRSLSLNALLPSILKIQWIALLLQLYWNMNESLYWLSQWAKSKNLELFVFSLQRSVLQWYVLYKQSKSGMQVLPSNYISWMGLLHIKEL